MALLSALLLGCAVGVLYDCFRVLRCRVRLRLLGGALDLLFWLCVTLALFLHALATGGGVLRLYMVAAVLAGACAYFLLLSPGILFLGYRLADLAGLLLRLVIFPLRWTIRLCKKVGQNLKKDFHYRRKWYRIRTRIGEMEQTAPTRAAVRRGGEAHEDKTRGLF